MPIVRFLVELYLAPGEPDPAAAARQAADDVTNVVESIEVPVDETCFLVVEAATEVDVTKLMERAGLRINRITVAHTRR